MSPDPRHLRDWIADLYTALDRAEPHSAAGVRKLAGARTSRMVLEEDRVSVRFADAGLRVARMRKTAKLTPPFGRTDRQTVTALLLGYLEVSDAIQLGQIELRGTADEVMDICAIIEILVDASTRIPELQSLAAAFLTTTTSDGLSDERRARQAHTVMLRDKEAALLLREGLRAMPRNGS